MPTRVRAYVPEGFDSPPARFIMTSHDGGKDKMYEIFGSDGTETTYREDGSVAKRVYADGSSATYREDGSLESTSDAHGTVTSW